MTNCLGSVISVDCGEFGYYQGRLISLDADSKDIVLGSAFKEGVPLGKNMTLNGSQIVSLKVLKAAQPADEAQAVSSSEKKENARKARQCVADQVEECLVAKEAKFIEFDKRRRTEASVFEF
ncbi:unnamed protein product [Heligmosomoides polygyrus]|uniref:LSM14 domain-containing protein n=1 Tax=Heligmosomoides polygyrus TaxID=6339 RepID=A0A183F6W5_HELPZ|nr:unnamed protein product [Heligmosomoides polygyrus]